jgi:hypothetical protein
MTSAEKYPLLKRTLTVLTVGHWKISKKIKEWGFISTYYTCITVFIRDAANLTLLLLQGSKLRKGNKN